MPALSERERVEVPDRLMVGHRPLEAGILVRIQVRQNMIFSDEAQKHLWNKIPGKYQTTAAIVISITLVVGGLLFFKSNPATPTTQESTESPCSISTIGQSGGTNNVDCKTEAEPQVVSQKSWLNEYKLGLYKQKLELKISNSPDDPSKLTASVQLLDQNNFSYLGL